MSDDNLEWITNVSKDPASAFSVMMAPAGRRHEALRCEREWRSAHIEGPPKASATMAVADMVRAGMIGLYRPAQKD